MAWCSVKEQGLYLYFPLERLCLMKFLLPPPPPPPPVGFINYYWGDQIKEDKMGGACSTHERNDKCLQYFSPTTWR
jgi:hypothetical protein